MGLNGSGLELDRLTERSIRAEVTLEDHERRITQLEGLVFKLFLAALGGSAAGGGAVAWFSHLL